MFIEINLLKENCAPKSQNNPEITKEQVKLIFDRFDILLNFYYTEQEIQEIQEIQEMKETYNL